MSVGTVLEIRNLLQRKSEPDKGVAGSVILLLFCMLTIFISSLLPLFFTLQVLSIKNKAGIIVLSAVVIAWGLAGVVIGLFVFRHIFWLIRIKNNIRNLPTAKIRSAAMGLVELKGVARPLDIGDDDAPILSARSDPDMIYNRIMPFRLEDDTGKLLVRPPHDADIGTDDYFHLTRNFVQQGMFWERSLMPGDTIYALGNLTTERIEESNGQERTRDVLKPWDPGWRSGLFDELLLSIPTRSRLNRRFGWMAPAIPVNSLFLLSDSDEAQAKKHLFRRAGSALAMTCIWLIGSVFLGAIGMLGVANQALLIKLLMG